MDDGTSEWQRKHATLSDKTARREFALTQDEIIQAIRAGKLQFRHAAMHGNPYLRLLRREVETLVQAMHGEDGLKKRLAKAELARINLEMKRVRAQLASLEERRCKLIADLGT